MSALVSGLVGAVVAAALLVVADRLQKPARADAQGWKMLRTGWLLNGTIVGCAGLSALIGYVVLFVGSSRPDAGTQMTIALILAVAFGSAAIYVAWANYRRTIKWKGDELCVRTGKGREQVRRISDISSVEGNAAQGEYRLTFKDGSILRISAYLDGARELAANLPNRVHAD